MQKAPKTGAFIALFLARSLERVLFFLLSLKIYGHNRYHYAVDHYCAAEDNELIKLLGISAALKNKLNRLKRLKAVTDDDVAYRAWGYCDKAAYKIRYVREPRRAKEETESLV